jgi:hypothetical protein
MCCLALKKKKKTSEQCSTERQSSMITPYVNVDGQNAETQMPTTTN